MAAATPPATLSRQGPSAVTILPQAACRNRCPAQAAISAACFAAQTASACTNDHAQLARSGQSRKCRERTHSSSAACHMCSVRHQPPDAVRELSLRYLGATALQDVPCWDHACSRKHASRLLTAVGSSLDATGSLAHPCPPAPHLPRARPLAQQQHEPGGARGVGGRPAARQREAVNAKGGAQAEGGRAGWLEAAQHEAARPQPAPLQAHALNASGCAPLHASLSLTCASL